MGSTSLVPSHVPVVGEALLTARYRTQNWFFMLLLVLPGLRISTIKSGQIRTYLSSHGRLNGLWHAVQESGLLPVLVDGASVETVPLPVATDDDCDREN